jgi:hypothetical protein
LLLKTYRFDGTDWTQIGNGLTITGISTPEIVALSSTQIAFIDSANDSLRAYNFDGTDWTLTGSGLAIATVGVPALAKLSSTDVAFIDSTNDSLRTYRFNGSTWSQVGNSFALTTGDCALTALNSTDVAFIDATNDSLRTYRFDGADWLQTGNSFAIGTVGVPTIAALNSAEIAFIDETNDSLRTYSFGGIAGVIEKRDWNVGNARSVKKFWALAVSQPTTANSCIMRYYADADGTTYAAHIGTVDLSTVGKSEHRIPITANHSLGMKNTGTKLSVKITESGSNQVSDIEQIELLYYPGVVR